MHERPYVGATQSATITRHPHLGNLAQNLAALSEYGRVRSPDEDTMTRRRRVVGEDHPDTITGASQLAMDLWLLGD